MKKKYQRNTLSTAFGYTSDNKQTFTHMKQPAKQSTGSSDF